VSTLAAGQFQPLGIAVDSANVYWATNSSYSYLPNDPWTPPRDNGAVVRIPLCGGVPTTLASGQVFSAGSLAIAIDATNVYWLKADIAGADGAVMKVPLGGGEPTAIASGPTVIYGPVGIAVDGANVYWTNNSGGTVMKVPVGGGTVSTLASGQITPYGIAVDSTSVYWTNNAEGTVKKLPISGGTITTLSSGQSSPLSITVRSANVYWTNQGAAAKNYMDSAVMKLPVDGGTPVTLASGQVTADCVGIAVDERNVYWTSQGAMANQGTVVNNSAGGIVMKVPLDGGAPSALVVGQYEPNGIAVYANSLYFTDYGGGAVVKVTPK
jgi:hypothetical protein